MEDAFCIDSLVVESFEAEFNNHTAIVDYNLNELNEAYVVQVSGANCKKSWLPHFETLPQLEPQHKPSEEEHPALELKQLPEHLKYAFLGEENRFPVVISSYLSLSEENRLLEVLKKHKKAIGWTIGDIKGINPHTCMHHIFLEEDTKPFRYMQRRLNPTLKEVVKKEILKLLESGIIYPISDSRWVSPIQVVPKKSGLTVVKSDKDELIPMRTTTGWRMCIDYRRLNSKTKKGPFSFTVSRSDFREGSGACLLLFSRWVFGILSSRYSSGGPRKNDIYLSFRHFCFQTHAFWSM